jgi:hypothetical protein
VSLNLARVLLLTYALLLGGIALGVGASDGTQSDGEQAILTAWLFGAALVALCIGLSAIDRAAEAATVSAAAIALGMAVIALVGS